MAKLQQKRSHTDAISFGGKIYVVGGYNSNSLATVESYDPSKKIWNTVANLNVPRFNHRCCVSKGAIYAIGGCGNSLTELLASIEKYDVQLDKWTIVSYRSFILALEGCLYEFDSK